MSNKQESLILYGSPFILLLILSYFYDFNGLYGQDSHSYYKYSRELYVFFENGTKPGFFYWPVVYPLLGTLLHYLWIPILFSLRLISFFSLIGCLFYSNKIIKIIYQKDGKLWLFLSSILATYFVRNGFLVMSDMFAAFIVVLSFYHFINFFYLNKRINIFYFLVLLILSFFVRYACLPLFLVPLIILVKRYFKDLTSKKIYVLIVSVFLIISVLVLNREVVLNLTSEFLIRWNFSNIFYRIFSNSDGSISHLVPNVFYVLGNFFHLGYLSFGVFLIPFYKKWNKKNKFFIFSVVLYLVFLAGFSTQNYRFLVISHLLVVIILFPVFVNFKAYLESKKLNNVFYITVIVFSSLFFIYSFRKTYAVHWMEKRIVNEVVENYGDELIYSFYVDQSFPSYDLKNEVKNFYTEEYLNFEKGSLVIFNEVKFKKQWTGTIVFKNWNNLNRNNTLEVLSSLENGWKIYRIK